MRPETKLCEHFKYVKLELKQLLDQKDVKMSHQALINIVLTQYFPIFVHFTG